MTQTESLKRRFPWDFFALTFCFSWLAWLPVVLGTLQVIPFPAGQYASALFFVGVFGPMVAACTLTYRDEGWEGLRLFVGRLFRVRFRPVWWGAIILLPLAIQAAAHYLPLLTGEQSPPTGLPAPGAFLSTLLLVTLLGGGQEEFGWRGYALDRIRLRYNAVTASLILGVLWACWHLPLWLMPGTSMGFTPFGPFVLALLGLSVILTWIYANTGGSILAVMLAHGLMNAYHSVLPVFLSPGSNQRVYTYWSIIYAIAALTISFIWGPNTLTGKKGVTVEQPTIASRL